MRAALSNIALLAALSQGAHAVIGIPLEWDESVEKMTDSADTFCFFVWCVTGPEGQTVTYDAATEHQSMNRQDIGQKSVLFNDGGKEKYGTERQSDDHTWGDEYPFASSLEGGEDLAGHPTAVLRGATQPDQSLQGNWIKNVLWKTGENAGQMKNTPVTITIKNPNTDLSPACAAYMDGDKEKCKLKNRGTPQGLPNWYFRKVAGSGGTGKKLEFEPYPSRFDGQAKRAIEYRA